MSEEPPVVPGPLYGLRDWDLGEGDRLGPAFGGGRWERGTTTARCAVGGAHDAPDPACSCGLYALHPSPEAIGNLALLGEEWVAGIVEAWGRVDVHETGFRAEHARPHALVVPSGASRTHSERVRRVARAHGVAVLELESGEELHEHCRRHGLGLDPSAVRELLAPARRRHLARRVLAGVASIVVGVPALVGALAVLRSVDWSTDAPAAGPPPLRLQILEEALVDADGDDLYVAVVRNPSRSRAALRAYPTGEFLDGYGDVVGRPDDPGDVDNRPSLAPGQVGVVYDFVESLEPLAHVVEELRVRVVADAAPGVARPPIAVSRRVRLEQRRCLLSVTVQSDRRRLETELTGLARNRRGRITAAGSWTVGPLPRGRSSQVLDRAGPRACMRGRLRLEAYPFGLPADVTLRPPPRTPGPRP